MQELSILNASGNGSIRIFLCHAGKRITVIPFVITIALILLWNVANTQTATKQLYLSDPVQTLDRIDPVATADVTTVQSALISYPFILVITRAEARHFHLKEMTYSLCRCARLLFSNTCLHHAQTQGWVIRKFAWKPISNMNQSA